MLSTIFLVCLALLDPGSVRGSSVRNGDRSVCQTEDCREFAAGIMASMNGSVDPCDNFYEYACGNWPERHPIPAGNNVWKFLTIAGQKNKRKVEDLLGTESSDDEIQSVRTAKRFYKACIDTDDRDKRGLEPILSILSKIGGWPITMAPSEWNGRKYKWQRVDDYYGGLKGANLFHELRVASYGTNSTGLSAVLDVPDLPPATWLLNSDMEADDDDDVDDESPGEQSVPSVNRNGTYWRFARAVISGIADATGASVPASELDKGIEDVLKFQWRLDKLTYGLDQYRNMTIRGFQKWYNDLHPNTENAKVNWTGKIVNTFKEAGLRVDLEENLKVVSPDYFKQLVPLLDGTPTRVIVNYLHWHFVSSTISKTTTEMRTLYEQTIGSSDLEDGAEKEEKEAEKEEVSRSELCIEEARMNDVIAYEYIRKRFSNEILSTALHAIEDIRKEIEAQIRGSDWANEEIKGLALRKLRTLRKNVGYPEWYKNVTLMSHLLDGLTVGPSYFRNSLYLERFHRLKQLRLLKYNETAKPWIVDALTINAFYLSTSNSITVPAANLEAPFFSSTQPNTINYGLTGYLLAHEMNHGYDEQRHIYNELGEEIAWPDRMANQYNRSVQCFIRQMDDYTLDGTASGPRIDGYGNQTLDENMCDTMGLRAAFRAYKRRESINGKPESSLPGLEMFDNDQTFFLSFANLFCESIRPEYLTIVPKFDIHATGRLRVTGSLSNNEDFARAFNCKIGSPMNPERKCSIWKHADDELRRGRFDEYKAHQV